MTDIKEDIDLFFFTAEFPYAKNETFIENEIAFLSKSFKNVFVLPYSKTNETRPVPNNFKIIDKNETTNSAPSSSLFLKNIFLIFKILFQEFLHTNKKIFYIKNIRLWNSYLIKAFNDANFINKQFTNLNNKIVFYSYWMNDWVLALSILKEQRKIQQFVFRCGGFDIWDDRHPGNYLPFQYFNYRNTSKVIPNSIHGENYIKNKKMFPGKVKHSYWGTNDHGLNPFNTENIFTMVSCSNLIPLKRVELIIEILKNIEFSLNWVHFGDGSLMNEIILKSKELPNNINITFKGRVSNQEVLKFYKKHPVNLFITTSSTESLPVSIQEAISFGIPIIATNVGGIREIVNEQTGILIDKDFDTAKIAQKITDFKNSSKNSVEYRNGVRDFWRKNFNAVKVYEEFCNEIKMS